MAFGSPLFLLGLASAPVVSQGGLCSMLAPWVGGACAPAVVEQGGARSLVAFWAGGACAAPVTASVTATVLGKPYIRERIVRDEDWIADDEELMEILVMISPIL